jgi:hypothetical protein
MLGRCYIKRDILCIRNLDRLYGFIRICGVSSCTLVYFLSLVWKIVSFEEIMLFITFY